MAKRQNHQHDLNLAQMILSSSTGNQSEFQATVDATETESDAKVDLVTHLHPNSLALIVLRLCCKAAKDFKFKTAGSVISNP